MNNELNISLEEQRKIQLEGLLYIKKLCDANNIKYFLISGTLLGAVKYKGYIPWDNDIDICLLRPDYLKLIEVIEKDKNLDFEVLTIYNTKDYYYPYAKLVSKKTKLLDNAKEIKELGVFVDIFPMDYFDDDIYEIFNRIRFIRNMSSKRMRIKNENSKLNSNVKFKFIKDIVYNIVDIISLPLGYKYWVVKLDKILNRYKIGKYVGTLYFDDILKLDKSLFDKQVEYEFEGYRFTSIADYDKYLKLIYGDYWLDPPAEEQCSPHQLDVKWRKEYNE